MRPVWSLPTEVSRTSPCTFLPALRTRRSISPDFGTCCRAGSRLYSRSVIETTVPVGAVGDAGTGARGSGAAREEPVVLVVVSRVSPHPAAARTAMPASARASRVSSALLNGQSALHARLPVAGDRAEERVLAWLERGADRRGAALLNDLALHVHAAPLDGDSVRDRRWVGHRDGHLARLPGQRALVELERAARIGGERELLAAAPRGWRGVGRRGARRRRCAR